MQLAKKFATFILLILFALALTTCGSTGGQMNPSALLPQYGKMYNAANPLITQMYCADPTAIEHEGRLYVYGTNDHQQYLHNVKGKNTYERIKSLVMMSTDDKVNWTYHGTINTGAIAPWIIASWAPSIVSRVEADGKTHFYLYFSNSGWGVGVLTATSPTGPWTDPLKKSLVDGNTKGLGTGCKAVFDPGVVIDSNGVGWLSFGGSGSYDDPDKDYFPGGARIVRLGDDMLSLASEIMEIPAPYHFEANELNYINDTYVYTYNTSWIKRDKWEIQGIAPPTACCMSYMTSKTPLDPKSWVYRGNYLRNPGENGMEYSNNHTHLHKYNDQYYLFYHTLVLQKEYEITGGFRSIFADRIEVNEDTLQIPMLKPTSRGVSQIKNVNPHTVNLFATLAVSAGLSFEPIDQNGNMSVVAKEPGSWEMIRGVDFNGGAATFSARVKGKGSIEIRLDSINASSAGYMEFSASDWKEVNIGLPETISVKHDVFFLFGGEGLNVHTWKFVE
jgi:hypothetical protein